ncbi:DUF2076 family protein [Massilia solisilvae]|uniref:DUF2076 family protein n=1 Tax=Massilia solisilvae TaxID=1811225 RepID=A0ABT2BR27_9BURK|nr:DUF2076 family protein [Massilia solisilvae]MCS0610323.1 DUF2076 family protein [Massilia solisilvae]
MSPQDSQLLQDFLYQLVQARGVAKDPEAEALISRAVARQPDAAYLLVQRALLMQQALNNARAEIAALQNQLRAQPAPAFLDPNTWGNSGTSRPSASQPVAPAPYQQQYQQPHPGSAQAQVPATPGGFLSGRGGGMLGNIAATAAGVAGGAFLFQGLEHLLGNHAGNGFLGPQSALNRPPEETTIVNNYYDDPERGRTDRLADTQDGGNLFDSSDQAGNDFDQLADDLGPDDDLFS